MTGRFKKPAGASGSVVWRKGKEKTPPNYQDFLLAGIASLADYFFFFGFFPPTEKPSPKAKSTTIIVVISKLMPPLQGK